MTVFLVNRRDLPRMNLGVIADDVTGGTDLASVLRRDRLSVIQTLGVPESAPPPADAVVVSENTDGTDREASCKQFDMCMNPEDLRAVFLYEIYTDDAAFGAHLKMPHFLAFDADTRAWIEHKVVEKWERP